MKETGAVGYRLSTPSDAKYINAARLFLGKMENLFGSNKFGSHTKHLDDGTKINVLWIDNVKYITINSQDRVIEPPNPTTSYIGGLYVWPADEDNLYGWGEPFEDTDMPFGTPIELQEEQELFASKPYRLMKRDHTDNSVKAKYGVHPGGGERYWTNEDKSVIISWHPSLDVACKTALIINGEAVFPDDYETPFTGADISVACIFTADDEGQWFRVLVDRDVYDWPIRFEDNKPIVNLDGLEEGEVIGDSIGDSTLRYRFGLTAASADGLSYSCVGFNRPYQYTEFEAVGLHNIERTERSEAEFEVLYTNSDGITATSTLGMDKDFGNQSTSARYSAIVHVDFIANKRVNTTLTVRMEHEPTDNNTYEEYKGEVAVTEVKVYGTKCDYGPGEWTFYDDVHLPVTLSPKLYDRTLGSLHEFTLDIHIASDSSVLYYDSNVIQSYKEGSVIHGWLSDNWVLNGYKYSMGGCPSSRYDFCEEGPQEEVHARPVCNWTAIERDWFDPYTPLYDPNYIVPPEDFSYEGGTSEHTLKYTGKFFAYAGYDFRVEDGILAKTTIIDFTNRHPEEVLTETERTHKIQLNVLSDGRELSQPLDSGEFQQYVKGFGPMYSELGRRANRPYGTWSYAGTKTYYTYSLVPEEDREYWEDVGTKSYPFPPDDLSLYWRVVTYKTFDGNDTSINSELANVIPKYWESSYAAGGHWGTATRVAKHPQSRITAIDVGLYDARHLANPYYWLTEFTFNTTEKTHWMHAFGYDMTSVLYLTDQVNPTISSKAIHDSIKFIIN